MSENACCACYACRSYGSCNTSHSASLTGDENAQLRHLFFVIPLVAAVFGFGHIAAGTVVIARMLFSSSSSWRSPPSSST